MVPDPYPELLRCASPEVCAVPMLLVYCYLCHSICTAAADRRFNLIHCVAPMWPPMTTHWCHLADTIELVRPLVRWARGSNCVTMWNQLVAGSQWWSTIESSDTRPCQMVAMATSLSTSTPPSNAWFTGTTRIVNPNGISIGSAVFAGLTNVTDRQTTLLGP